MSRLTLPWRVLRAPRAFRTEAGRQLPIALLRGLLLAAIALPVLALTVGSVLLWREVAAQAEQDLHQRAEIAAENAARVFETHDLILREAARVTAGLSDGDLRAQEQSIHARLQELMYGLPQVFDVLVAGAQGELLASARQFPVAHVSIAGRPYFRAMQSGEPEPYIGAPLNTYLDGTRVFVVARRRSDQAGHFAGVVGIAIDPAYFVQRYFATGLADPVGDSTMALVRTDGVALARAPSIQPPPAASPSQPFRDAVASNTRTASYTMRSNWDGEKRAFFLRKIGGLPIYVAASVSYASIWNDFLSALWPHFIFGAPATIGLVCLVLLALRRTQQAEESRLAREDAERALAQASKLESVGQLAAGVAHDFNNILAASMGNLQLLLRRLATGRTEDVQKLAERALAANRRGAELTRRIMAFARPGEASAEVLDVGEAVERVVELLPSLLGPTIRIETELPAGLWPVQVVPALLDSALINLAANARDVMPDGGVLRIAGSNLPQTHAQLPMNLPAGHDWIRLAVSDTGPGFPPEVKARAFEPFLTTKEVGRGTGLGLAQVYAFARHAGGVAVIEDTPGSCGATVAVYLPRSHVAAAHRPSPEQAVLSGDHATGPIRILLVDDDRDVREASAASMRDAGHEVLEAEDSVRGLELLATHGRIDLLVVDYVMPGANGVAMIAEARRMRPALPIVLVSGQADLSGMRLPRNVRLIAKPFRIEDLQHAIGDAVREAQGSTVA